VTGVKNEGLKFVFLFDYFSFCSPFFTCSCILFGQNFARNFCRHLARIEAIKIPPCNDEQNNNKVYTLNNPRDDLEVTVAAAGWMLGV
jgi:hypothetical protein